MPLLTADRPASLNFWEWAKKHFLNKPDGHYSTHQQPFTDHLADAFDETFERHGFDSVTYTYNPASIENFQGSDKELDSLGLSPNSKLFRLIVWSGLPNRVVALRRKGDYFPTEKLTLKQFGKDLIGGWYSGDVISTEKNIYQYLALVFVKLPIILPLNIAIVFIKAPFTLVKSATAYPANLASRLSAHGTEWAAEKFSNLSRKVIAQRLAAIGAGLAKWLIRWMTPKEVLASRKEAETRKIVTMQGNRGEYNLDLEDYFEYVSNSDHNNQLKTIYYKFGYDNSLEYKVFDSNGVLRRGIIPPEELRSLSRLHGLEGALDKLLPKMLETTDQRGHTGIKKKARDLSSETEIDFSADIEKAMPNETITPLYYLTGAALVLGIASVGIVHAAFRITALLFRAFFAPELNARRFYHYAREIRITLFGKTAAPYISIIVLGPLGGLIAIALSATLYAIALPVIFGAIATYVPIAVQAYTWASTLPWVVQSIAWVSHLPFVLVALTPISSALTAFSTLLATVFGPAIGALAGLFALNISTTMLAIAPTLAVALAFILPFTSWMVDSFSNAWTRIKWNEPGPITRIVNNLQESLGDSYNPLLDETLTSKTAVDSKASDSIHLSPRDEVTRQVGHSTTSQRTAEEDYQSAQRTGDKVDEHHAAPTKKTLSTDIGSTKKEEKPLDDGNDFSL